MVPRFIKMKSNNFIPPKLCLFASVWDMILFDSQSNLCIVINLNYSLSLPWFDYLAFLYLIICNVLCIIRAFILYKNGIGFIIFDYIYAFRMLRYLARMQVSRRRYILFTTINILTIALPLGFLGFIFISFL